MPLDRSDTSIPLAGASNFRDLGGLPCGAAQAVRCGRVFRSDHLGRLGAGDHARLHALGVTHCVDLRGRSEREATPDRLPGVVMEHLAIEPTVLRRLRAMQAAGTTPGQAEAVALMCDTYSEFVRQQGPVFGRLLARVADHDAALVFHCTAGKDRTGMAAALLLEALGVHRDDVMEDYLLTNRLYRRDHQLVESAPQEVLDVLWQVQAEFLLTAWHCIDHEFGGLERYLAGPMGLTPVHRERLHERLLADRNDL